MKLSELKKGKKATIQGFTNDELSIKLMEMGCLPGEDVRVQHVAPAGDPIAVSVCGYLLSLRVSEADTILISSEAE